MLVDRRDTHIYRFTVLWKNWLLSFPLQKNNFPHHTAKASRVETAFCTKYLCSAFPTTSSKPPWTQNHLFCPDHRAWVASHKCPRIGSVQKILQSWRAVWWHGHLKALSAPVKSLCVNGAIFCYFWLQHSVVKTYQNTVILNNVPRIHI